MRRCNWILWLAAGLCSVAVFMAYAQRIELMCMALLGAAVLVILRAVRS